MSKAIANEILKAHGLGFVRYRSTGVSFTQAPCYTNSAGKRVKGIYCGQTGPLTVTNAVDQQKLATLRDLAMDLQKVLKRVSGTHYIVNETAKSITFLDLTAQQYPSYQRSADLDPSYMGHYIVPVYSTEKK